MKKIKVKSAFLLTFLSLIAFLIFLTSCTTRSQVKIDVNSQMNALTDELETAPSELLIEEDIGINHIKKITPIAEMVKGEKRLTYIVLEYDTTIEASTLDVLDFEIKDYVIDDIFTNNSGRIDDYSAGPYVVIKLSLNARPNKEDFTVKLSQVGVITSYDSVVLKDSYNYVKTRKEDTKELVIDEFYHTKYFMHDSSYMDYCIFIPKTYDDSLKYPITIVLGQELDSKSTSYDLLTTSPALTHFASQRDQNIHTSIIVSPVLTKRNSSSKSINEFISYIKGQYSIDTDRIYLVGYLEGVSKAVRLAVDSPADYKAVMLVGGDFPAATKKKLFELCLNNTWVVAPYEDKKSMSDYTKLKEIAKELNLSMRESYFTAGATETTRQSSAKALVDMGGQIFFQTVNDILNVIPDADSNELRRFTAALAFENTAMRDWMYTN